MLSRRNFFCAFLRLTRLGFDPPFLLCVIEIHIPPGEHTNQYHRDETPPCTVGGQRCDHPYRNRRNAAPLARYLVKVHVHHLVLYGCRLPGRICLSFGVRCIFSAWLSRSVGSFCFFGRSIFILFRFKIRPQLIEFIPHHS